LALLGDLKNRRRQPKPKDDLKVEDKNEKLNRNPSARTNAYKRTVAEDSNVQPQ